MNKLPEPKDIPAVVEPVTGPSLLTDAEVEAVAEEAGLFQLKGKNLAALRKLGEHIALQGVVHIGLSKVLLTEERIDEIRAKCSEVLESCVGNEETLDAIRAATAVDTLKLRAAELLVKMVEAKMVPAGDKPKKFSTFGVGEVVGPVQVNINTVPKETPQDTTPPS